MAKYVSILIRRDTQRNWEANNPKLKYGEIAVDITNFKLKVGNGIDDWNDLEYINGDLYNSFDSFTQEIIDKVKSIIEDVKTNQSSIKSINNRLAGLESRQYSFEKDVNEDIEDAKKDLDAGLANFALQVENIGSRLDVIVGSATEDTEILDARIDAENITHPNIGHNIRSIHSKLLEAVNILRKENSENDSLEREIRLKQDEGLQWQIDLLAQAIECDIIDRAELQRKFSEWEHSDQNVSRATNSEFEEMLDDVYDGLDYDEQTEINVSTDSEFQEMLDEVFNNN